MQVRILSRIPMSVEEKLFKYLEGKTIKRIYRDPFLISDLVTIEFEDGLAIEITGHTTISRDVISLSFGYPSNLPLEDEEDVEWNDFCGCDNNESCLSCRFDGEEWA